jgi:hypothetical protein
LGGFDTHDNQLAIHKNKLTELNDAVLILWRFKKAQLLQNVTIVVFSEFGRRVRDNGKELITEQPLQCSSLVETTKENNRSKPWSCWFRSRWFKTWYWFRSVYASILKNKLDFDPTELAYKTLFWKDFFKFYRITLKPIFARF